MFIIDLKNNDIDLSANCMEATLCKSQGGIPSTGICPGTSTNQCCDKAYTSVPINDKTPVNRMLTDLAEILRGAGLSVIESEGWQTRGHSVMTSVKSIICHHTNGPATGDFPSLRIVRDGRKDLAAGRSYHAGATIDDSVFGNPNAIGIEAEAVGVPLTNSGHEYWPEVQYQSYIRGVRALQAAYGVPASRVLGHKEAAAPVGRKPDPNFSMDEFRATLAK
ncbi:unnamed protein product [Adineta steineri]|uniref:N-acetylmuramoyl-L-alanine amidase domain-containing protein n=1 Tax=Adineta steineri TaxID=433720 RepID=A0A814P8G7_9BILA|nr:unnamed protein product [Adineta steineri]CAF1102228.1 unnamed protein product [Adineta steineri]